MTPDALLRRRLHTPTPDPRGYAYGLPPDMLQRAASRLSLIALIYASAYLVAYGVLRLFPHPHFNTRIAGQDVGDYLAGGFILLGIAVALIARKRNLSPPAVIRLGLVFEVVGAIGIEDWMLFRPIQETIEGVSWVCVWIVLFPLIVPAPTRLMLVATVASAATVPLLYLAGQAIGHEPASFPTLVNYFTPLLICVGIAGISHRVLTQLRADASQAERLGSYRLVERLGEGGMGEVWRAEHNLLARPAAIKLIRPETLGARGEGGRRELLARFEREAQATAALSSPHTVSLYDFGVSDDGAFYYVMELLQGLDLSTLVERFGPVDAGRTIHFLRHACDSLAEAHGAGLIHRDIKPANLYACRVGTRHDVVKVLDFGLVKSTGEGDETQSLLTMPQSTPGTPSFIAPETVSGDQPVDFRADIYSLGCVAYWLLTGTLVFQEGNSLKMALAHVSQEPEPPSARTEIPVPKDLEAIVMRCLKKRPDDRPESAAHLEDLLSRLPERAVWDETRAGKWWRHHLPEYA